MRIVVGADHGGFHLKQELVKWLKDEGHIIEDIGAHEYDQYDDYPDFAIRAAHEIKNGNVSRGIVICGSGVGASIASNKIKGIRASVCHDSYSAAQGVEHSAGAACRSGIPLHRPGHRPRQLFRSTREPRRSSRTENSTRPRLRQRSLRSTGVRTKGHRFYLQLCSPDFLGENLRNLSNLSAAAGTVRVRWRANNGDTVGTRIVGPTRCVPVMTICGMPDAPASFA